MKCILKMQLNPIEGFQIARLADYKLGFGRNKGKTLEHIWNTDRSYLSWFLGCESTECAIQQKRVGNFVAIKSKLMDMKVKTLR